MSTATTDIEAIVADNIDQAGSRVFTHRAVLGLTSASQSTVLIDGLDSAFVEFEDTERAGDGAYGLRVVGGSQAAAGNPHGGRVLWDSGSEYGDRTSVSTSNGAWIVLRDYWYESTGANTSTSRGVLR